ncbi:MAG: glycoside hydrolase family 16 protein [Bacteroidales bacterium]|nr:glycoside hydrolase family 16 protein [Bacteroidales bacterium]
MSQNTCDLYYDTVFNENIYMHSYDYELMFEDNFEDTILNTDYDGWEFEKNVIRDYNNKKLYLRKDNVVMENGVLNIIARKENLVGMMYFDENYEKQYGDFEYTSAKIKTKYFFPIGCKIEARIKLPMNYNLWPAFWLYGEDNTEHNYNEIDILELAYNELTCNSHFRYGNENLGNGLYSHSCPITLYTPPKIYEFLKEYHTYTLIWTNEKMEWYIDSILVREEFHYSVREDNSLNYYPISTDMLIKDSNYYQTMYFPKDSMQIILNIDIKKDFDNLNNFCDTMLVDYIRVYKIADTCYDDTVIYNDEGLNYNILGQNGNETIRGRNVFFKCNDINVNYDNNVSVKAINNVFFEKGFSVETEDDAVFSVDIERCLKVISDE